MTAQETLKDLVAINSISSNSNAEIIDYLESRVRQMGFKTRRFSHTDESGVEKINIVAVIGPESESSDVELALVGHTDTVPFDPSWEDALRLTARDGKLYGRGACDTKGFISAALSAVQYIDLKRLRRELALVFTSDEEIGCLGAKRLQDARALTTRYAIVGEPTSLRPMRAGKGYCLTEITVSGSEGHSAYPSVGASAIFRAARLVSRIERIAEELKEDARADLDPPHTTLNVGLIKGGTAKNIIAGRCSFTLEWRPVPGQKPELVIDLVRSAIEDERRRDAGFECEMTAPRIDQSFETPADSPLVHLLEEATGQASGTVAFGTEAPQMRALGADAVILGPGDIRVAHRTGEFVPEAELQSCVQILARAVKHFCA